jgi:hypothetical protein
LRETLAQPWWPGYDAIALFRLHAGERHPKDIVQAH